MSLSRAVRAASRAAGVARSPLASTSLSSTSTSEIVSGISLGSLGAIRCPSPNAASLPTSLVIAREMTMKVKLSPKNPRSKPPVSTTPTLYPYDAAKNTVVPTTPVNYKYQNNKLVVEPSNLKQEMLLTTNRGDPRFTFIFPEEPPYVLTASLREEGRDSSFDCRKTGFVPCVIHSTSSTRNMMLIAIEAMELERLGRRKDNQSLLINIVINGYEEPITCMVKQWIIEGSTQKTNTVSFATFEPQYKYKCSTPVTLVNTNDCAGLKRNSSLFQPIPHMRVTFIPSIARQYGITSPPTEFKLDVVDLVPGKIGGSIKSSDVPLPPFLQFEKGHEDHCLFTFHIAKRGN